MKKKKENKEVDLVKMANNSDDFDSTFDNSDDDFCFISHYVSNLIIFYQNIRSLSRHLGLFYQKY